MTLLGWLIKLIVLALFTVAFLWKGYDKWLCPFAGPLFALQILFDTEWWRPSQLLPCHARAAHCWLQVLSLTLDCIWLSQPLPSELGDCQGCLQSVASKVLGSVSSWKLYILLLLISMTKVFCWPNLVRAFSSWQTILLSLHAIPSSTLWHCSLF